MSTPTDLESLEEALQQYSHDDRALKIVREFAESLGKTRKRQEVFNRPGALVQPPILYEEALVREILSKEDDVFTFLQGDIVGTESAYFMGERINNGKYVVASSTCDLVPGRREYAILLRLNPIREDNPKAAAVIGELLSFKSIRRMYLPRLDDDESTVLCNGVELDGVAQIRIAELQMATRYGSLSLVGWRVFGTLIRNLIARTGEAEVKLRTRT
ncbi:hypothetical protein [Gloeobacter kilaueensis]|uniref:Uncharacterized protein n=1 Tax=Gloeobacter kilaueensis (strain ATCC BAA-2537 / CCAP 1431/1 / ULC 316 / JS1) TaxID=1183438 RepID=U5QCZ4_GLOK1|nr:hypothetical protein [Gloeobacter kilaueensis]AGY56792.1 hypothetical protein GKIL_0546 [Gloeobacter kilaueensis JS1]